MNRTALIDPQSLTWLELGEAQRLLIQQFPRLAFGLDLDGRVLWINPAGERALGFEPGELKDKPLIGTVLRREEIEARAAMLARELDARVPADASVFSARLRRGLVDEHAWVLRTKDGEPRTVNLSLGTLRAASGSVVGLLAVECEGQLPPDAPLALTHHDSLTGLPTRAVLQDRAEMAMQRAARAQTKVGVLLVELHGFEQLCEQHGASIGDDLLRATAGRLHFELRKTDSAARMPGGQFVAMLVDLHQVDEAERVAHKIAAALSNPVNTGVEVIKPRCRVGVAVYPDHGDQLLPLMEAANQALRTTDGQSELSVAVAAPVSR
ncbi:diguanylate cyclase [Ideonella sp. DXS29W]|uniref:Diguanylate cyclase n=1 Tax=Ideonella lacteola TaxID=2984193 RepID=A0ABU9BNR8_9BURK